MAERIKMPVLHSPSPRPAEPAREPAPKEKPSLRLRLEALEERRAPGVDTTPSFRLP